MLADTLAATCATESSVSTDCWTCFAIESRSALAASSAVSDCGLTGGPALLPIRPMSALR